MEQIKKNTINEPVVEKCIECDRPISDPDIEGICNECSAHLSLTPKKLFRMYRAAKIISQFILKSTNDLPLERLLDELANMFNWYFNFQRMTIYAYERDKEQLKGFCDSSVPKEYLFSLIIPLNKEPETGYKSRDVVAAAFRTDKTIVVNDRSQDPSYIEYLKLMSEGKKPQKVFSKSFIAVPLRTRLGVVGVLALYRMDSMYYHPVTGEEKETLDLIAYQVASIIDAFFPKFYNKLNAILDGLTGLYNHLYFQERLKEELFYSDRKQQLLSVLMIDIDHFKAFNDEFGHQEGDRVLKLVSQCIKMSVREDDVVCRYGGEEIAAILPKANTSQAREISERIRKAVESIKEHKITVSIGHSTFPEDLKIPDKEELIKIADSFLYQAKEAGRNRVCP